MANYSIKDMEKLSGIKAHTIRMWEKRYGIIEPSRTKTNIRFYCDEDIKQIINIAILKKSGVKISDIAKLSRFDINDRIIHLSQKTTENAIQIDNLVISMLELDENKFNKILSKSILETGFEQTIEKVVFPFLEKIGVLWQTGSITPAHEHFISNLIRQKLVSSIDNLPTTITQISKTLVLFLPEGEIHELGLLFYYYAIKKRNHKIVYLGQSVPFNDLVQIKGTLPAEIFVTSFTSNTSRSELKNYIQKLSQSFPSQKIFISGPQLINYPFSLPSNVFLFKNADELISYLQN